MDGVVEEFKIRRLNFTSKWEDLKSPQRAEELMEEPLFSKIVILQIDGMMTIYVKCMVGGEPRTPLLPAFIIYCMWETGSTYKGHQYIGQVGPMFLKLNSSI